MIRSKPSCTVVVPRVSGGNPDNIASNKDIAARVKELERGHDRSASVIEILAEDIDRLAHEVKEMRALPPVTKRRIGFRLDDDD
jgi:hypothetical protein